MYDASETLETLFLPFAEARVQWTPEGVLFLRARMGRALQDESRSGLVCEQTFKPDADALERAGFPVVTDASARYKLILLLPPRQRAEARALMARAFEHLAPGGRIVACAANNEGARSSEADLERLAGPLETLSKNKHRVFWTRPLDRASDAPLVDEWRRLDEARPIEGGRFISRPGVFAWDRIDSASHLLASHLPRTLSGHAADLGAGFGYLSVELLERCAGITALDVYEAEARALELARRNLAAFEARAAIAYRWHDVAAGLPHRYDAIVTNPPFHTQGAVERPDIGRRFIVAAAAALNPGGRLLLVANRHLPYESVLNASFGRMRIVAQEKGYKVVEAVKQTDDR